MAKINRSEYNNLIKKQKDKKRASFNQDLERIGKLINKKSNVVIKYPEYAEAYNYVEKKFPGLNVFNVTVFKVSKKDLAEAGYDGVGGLYVFGRKQVIASDFLTGGTFSEDRKIVAKITFDEIIVHELLHYVSHKIYRTHNVMMEEEFAYGHSVPYLKSKGYTDSEIINYNMMPFLYTCVNQELLLEKLLKEKNIKPSNFNGILRKIKSGTCETKMKEVVDKIQEDLHKRTLEIATQKGQFLIDHYKNTPDGEVNDQNNRDLEI